MNLNFKENPLAKECIKDEAKYIKMLWKNKKSIAWGSFHNIKVKFMYEKKFTKFRHLY